jgi:hypothetical protein
VKAAGKDDQMPRRPAEDNVIDLRPAPGGNPDAVPVCEQLRQIVAAVDLLWNESLRSPGDQSTLLGQASNGLHRAMIALQEPCG